MRLLRSCSIGGHCFVFKIGFEALGWVSAQVILIILFFSNLVFCMFYRYFYWGYVVLVSS